jgi:hypothetical protein
MNLKRAFEWGRNRALGPIRDDNEEEDGIFKVK